MNAKFRTAAAALAIVLGGLILAACASPADPADADARAAIQSSFEESGWADGLTASQLEQDVTDTLSVAKTSCANGYYASGSSPELGLATVAGMAVICPDVAP